MKRFIDIKHSLCLPVCFCFYQLGLYSVSYTANEYSIYHICIIIKDFFISFSRVIIVQDFETVRPGFHLQQTPRPRHKKQSDYVVEQSSLPLIALFWLKIGRCRGRNRLYGTRLYFHLLLVYKPTFSVIFCGIKRVRVSRKFNSLFILYISTAKPINLVKRYIEVKISKHDIW